MVQKRRVLAFGLSAVTALSTLVAVTAAHATPATPATANAQPAGLVGWISSSATEPPAAGDEVTYTVTYRTHDRPRATFAALDLSGVLDDADFVAGSLRIAVKHTVGGPESHADYMLRTLPDSALPGINAGGALSEQLLEQYRQKVVTAASSGKLPAGEAQQPPAKLLFIYGLAQLNAVHTVSFTVKVRADAAKRGDNRLTPFLLHSPVAGVAGYPNSCGDTGDTPRCLSVPVAEPPANANIQRSIETRSDAGGQLREGDRVSFDLNFRNTGDGPARVDAVTDLSDVLDDADLVGSITASEGLTVQRTTSAGGDSAADAPAGVDQQRGAASQLAVISPLRGILRVSRETPAAAGTFLRITGTVQPGETATVTFTVSVRAAAERGNGNLVPFVVDSGANTPEVCDPSSAGVSCATVPAAPQEDPADSTETDGGKLAQPVQPVTRAKQRLAATGGDAVPAVAAGLALTVLAGAAIAARRRNRAAV